MNFSPLGLKKLIATCYATSPVIGKEFIYYTDPNGQNSFVPNEFSVPLQETSLVGERSLNSGLLPCVASES